MAFVIHRLFSHLKTLEKPPVMIVSFKKYVRKITELL